MKHLGDITKINGYEAPVVDVVIGGSPCQDLSLAGKRAGLSGARSGLYMEQIRIIKEMRKADVQRGKPDVDIRPRYMVWENVPGAFSTNQGQDFAAVLEEAIRIAEPEAPDIHVPEKGWSTAGCFYDEMGKWSIAWRVLDAQFWGTPSKPLPQRRRRIALVADFGGLSAPEILFVTQGVSGNSEPGKQKGERTPRTAEESTGGAIPCSLKIRGGCSGEGKGALIQENKSATLSTLQDQTLFQPIYGLDQQGGKGGANYAVNVSPPILSDSHGTPHAVAYGIQGSMIGRADKNGPQGDGVNKNISFTLNTTDRHAVVYGISPYHSNCMKSDNPHSGYYEAETSRTLDSQSCGYPGCNQGGMAVVQPVCFEPGACSRMGGYCYEDLCGTLRATMGDNQPAVAYSVESHPMDSRVDINEKGIVQSLTERMGTGGGNVPMVMETYQKVTGPLMANSHPGSYTGQDAFSDMLVTSYAAGGFGNYTKGVRTLRASGGDYGGGTETLIACTHIVRRLTPLECERLQGFPDGWTLIGDPTEKVVDDIDPESGLKVGEHIEQEFYYTNSQGKRVKCSDSVRYKALGNSIAIPPWKWVLKRLCSCYERDATMASLFDGIGGFPYIWEQFNGKGSCLWASEIEEFPMAVTMKRFGG